MSVGKGCPEAMCGPFSVTTILVIEHVKRGLINITVALNLLPTDVIVHVDVYNTIVLLCNKSTEL